MSVVAFDPTLDFLALYADQDEATILARWEDWANEGLDPVADADQWVDTREGGHWRTVLMPAVREFARLYDLAGTEVPMSAFVVWAWSTYLDDLAATYDVYRLPAVAATGVVVFTGADGDTVDAGTVVSASPVSEDDPAPTFRVTQAGVISGGTVELPIVAEDAGADGNVAANAITAPSTPLTGITFTNPDPTAGGEDPESDESLRRRTLQALQGKGPGTVADIVRWLTAIPGVGLASAVPTWRGAGTALGLITDPNGQPLGGDLVAFAQNELDPVAGKGAGTAPVGMALTVETSLATAIAVATTGIVFATGYSADGAGGTIAVRPLIESAIAAYLLTIPPGGSVVHSVIAGLVATAEGVIDAPTVTVNGGTVNVAIVLDPPHVPVLTTPITLA